jgi:chromosome segregation ATPase
MLESWFATLSSRLGVNSTKEETSHVPQALQQAMESFWDVALAKGREEADEKIRQGQHALTESRKALQAQENDLIQKEQMLAVRHAALEQALLAADSKAADLMSQLNQMQTLTSKRETEIETLRYRLVAVENEREADRCRAGEEAIQQAKERQRNDDRSDATQKKLLGEVDKARQEAKKLRTDAQIFENRFEAARQSFQQELRSQETDLIKAQELAASQTAELNGLRQALEVSNSRSDELRDLLIKHQAASETAIGRLTQAFSAQGGRYAAGTKLVARKVKRPIRLR